jgi:beta-1,2-mannobiose phosphorylase / 1,2-beta-oligomannan phosphorylase
MVPKKQKESSLVGLGVYSIHDRTFLYGITKINRNSTLSLQISTDGLNFYPTQNPQIFETGEKQINYTYLKNMRISSYDGKFLMCAKTQKPVSNYLSIFSSTDLIAWNTVGAIKSITEQAMIVPDYNYNGKTVMFFGDDTIKIGYSDNLSHWDFDARPLLTPRPDFFDYGALSVGNVSLTKEGIVLVYSIRFGERRDTHFGLGIALFDKNNPSKLLWRSPVSFFDQPDHFSYKMVSLIGINDFANAYISYWQLDKDGVSALFHPKHIQKHADKLASSKYTLKKLPKNPIMSPIASHPWESKAVFNPAALYDSGKVHLLYRAVGDSDGSVIGYAASQDGTSIIDRLDKPAYVPSQPFEYCGPNPAGGAFATAYFSGGMYGGCEDPRLTKLGNRGYMTYVAYNGSHPPRVALTSIDISDFRNKNWNWATPVLISPPGVVDKNACILPEKINGKYVIFHRIFPNILIDYVDNLDFDGTSYLKGEYHIGPRTSSWDSRKVGAGPPPMKTKDGWLLIYHAVGDRDPSRYKMGAMLLDLKNPTKVIARSKYPILEPGEWYENNGLKYGVAYPCGAVILKDKLVVYYGGSDMVTCAATADLPEFLQELKRDEIPHLHSVSFLPASLAANG